MGSSPDSRDIRLNVPDPRFNLCAFSIELNEFIRDGKFNGLYSTVDIANIPQNPEGIDEEVIQMVHYAIALRNGGDEARLRLDSINRTFAETLAKGTSNYRHGVRRTLENGSLIVLMGNTLDGNQTWEQVEREPDLRIRLQTSDMGIEFVKLRNGIVETYETDPDLAKAEASILGRDSVLKIGETVVVFDTGSNDQKRDVVEEMERVVGMREPKKEHMDLIQEALLELAA